MMTILFILFSWDFDFTNGAMSMVTAGRLYEEQSWSSATEFYLSFLWWQHSFSSKQSKKLATQQMKQQLSQLSPSWLDSTLGWYPCWRKFQLTPKPSGIGWRWKQAGGSEMKHILGVIPFPVSGVFFLVAYDTALKTPMAGSFETYGVAGIFAGAVALGCWSLVAIFNLPLFKKLEWGQDPKQGGKEGSRS